MKADHKPYDVECKIYTVSHGKLHKGNFGHYKYYKTLGGAIDAIRDLRRQESIWIKYCKKEKSLWENRVVFFKRFRLSPNHSAWQ